MPVTSLADLWTFLTVTHDLRSVLAAGLVCALSAAAGFSAMGFARGAHRGAVYLAAAAAAFGAGVWTTHFVAMVGWRPDLTLGFSTISLVLSAACALGAGVALTGAVRAETRAVAALRGAAGAGGVVLMHKLGVSGISGCVTEQSFGAALAGSLAGGALIAAAPLLHRRSDRGVALPTLTMTLGVATLHFVWMGGAQVIEAVGPVGGMSREDIAPIARMTVLGLGALLLGVTAAQARAGREVSRLAAVAANAQDGLMLLDARGRAEWVNPAFEELTGLDVEALRRVKPLDGLGAGPQDAAALATLRAGLAAGRAGACEARVRDAVSGEARWVHVGATPLPRGDGAVVALHDVSAQRARAEAEAAAREEADRVRARLLGALEVAPIGMAMFDADMRLIACNGAYRDLAPGPVGALAAGEAAPADFAGAVRDGLDRSPNGIESEFALPDGRWVWRRAQRLPSGEIMAARIDVTDLKARERDLEVACDRAQAASRAKSEFMSVMSHELRTPLNGVLGFGGLLSASPLTEAQKGYVARIMESGTLLLGVLNDILDLAALDTDALKLEEGRIDLEALANELRAEHGPAAAEKGLRLTVTRAKDAPEAVAGDRARLAQVLRCLLSNAVKFTEAGEVSLTIRAGSASGDRVEVIYEVADTGVGVAPEAVAKLFDAFSQADGSSTRRFGGVGLGLALASRLVRLMGGEISVQSRPGLGSTFRVRAPHRPASAALADVDSAVRAETAPPTDREAAAAWLAGPWPWLGYAAGLAAMAALDLLLWSLFVTLAGNPVAVLARLPETLLLLVGLNLAGGRALFAPVARWLRDGGDPASALSRLSRLVALSGWWAVAVAGLFSVSAFLVTPFLVYGLPPTAEVLALLTARAIAWSMLLPFVAYFLVADHVGRLRRAIFTATGLSAPPGPATLGRKLGLILAGGALAPGASIAATLTLVPPISPITGQPRELLIVVTLVGAGLALWTAYWAMRRSLDDSLGALTSAMDRVAAGARDVALPIQTDDELGRLADRFNVLTAALGESEAKARRAEGERAQATGRFHEAQKHAALGRLAGGIAHDFNNILAIIMGYADVARKRLPDGDRNAARLGEIVKAAERGKALIAQILSFVRARPPERVAMDLRASVAETLDWLGATVGRTVTIEARLPDGPMTVLGDATGMHQVLANLCVNAAHAMRGRAGSVRVTLDVLAVDGGRAQGLKARLGDGEPAVVVDDADPGRPRAFVGILGPGRYARLIVEDDGSGMTPEVLRHVFEPYFTTKAPGEGTGLGLAAVLGIVTQHDGAIALETTPGRGTTFRVLLPLIDGD